jgi:DNA-binding NtrC family response regulator
MASKKRILIVDDEPNVRLMLETTLASVGYEVTEASDGQAALDRVSDPENAPDLVLLDLLMPRMDGMELLRRLRAVGNVIPVVILTAHGSIPEAVEAMKLGAIDFLAKPTTPDALRRVVADVIARHDDAAATGEPKESASRPSDRSQGNSFEIIRAKRAINRGQFSEAEALLRYVIMGNPRSTEAHELLDRLLTLKTQEAHGQFRILRDWFPSGAVRGKR